MKKFYLILIPLVLLSANIYGKGNSERLANDLLMGSSSMGGTWYPTAAALAGEVMKHSISGVSITVQTSGGGVENIRLMIDGIYKMALVEPNSANYAMAGINMFEGQKYEGLRFVANLYPNVYHGMVMKNSPYYTYYDFKGANIRFSPDTPGSGDEYSWDELFEAYGMTREDFRWTAMTHSERVMSFKDRLVDCVGYFTACPSGSIYEASAQAPIRLLEIGEKEAAEIIAKYPWNIEYLIPAGTYNGQDEDVRTLAAGTWIMVDESVSDEFVYEIVTILYGKGLERIRSISSMTATIGHETALDGNTSQTIPIHPGALKYYKEKGLIK